MATLTTANLFSHQTFRDLILEPMIADSVVLPALRRIETDSSIVYLPRVSGGNVAWTAEAAEIADSNIAANMLEVIPRKLAGLVLTSNESIEDANAATILGTALARQLAAAVDASFFAAGGAPAPVGLPGVAGIPEVTAGGAGLDDYASAIGDRRARGGRRTADRHLRVAGAVDRADADEGRERQHAPTARQPERRPHRPGRARHLRRAGARRVGPGRHPSPTS